MNKVLLFLLGLFVGMAFGFSLAAWALYEPIHSGPAKYALTHSPGPVAPYTMDGTKKLFQIDCISASEKDCEQPLLPINRAAVSIPVPGTLGLVLVGGLAMVIRKQKVL